MYQSIIKMIRAEDAISFEIWCYIDISYDMYLEKKYSRGSVHRNNDDVSHPHSAAVPGTGCLLTHTLARRAARRMIYYVQTTVEGLYPGIIWYRYVRPYVMSFFEKVDRP